MSTVRFVWLNQWLSQILQAMRPVRSATVDVTVRDVIAVTSCCPQDGLTARRGPQKTRRGPKV